MEFESQSDKLISSSFIYQSDSVPNTLRSTGTVYLNRDQTGSDDQPVGLDNVPISHLVSNGRAAALKLDRNGFELFQHTYDHIDYFDDDSIVTRYYDEVCAFIKSVTGAKKVVAFDHNIRASKQKSWMNADGDETAKREIRGGNQIQSPASVVHNDYTLTSAPLRLAMLGFAPKVNDTWAKRTQGESLIPQDEIDELMAGRYVFINAWRNISTEPVREMPLGLCDAETLDPQDLVTFEIRYADRVGENYFARNNAAHRWYFFPEMTRDEVILLKVWDSYGDLAVRGAGGGGGGDAMPDGGCSTFSLHSAFKDPTSEPGCPPRESIEIRTVAFF